MDDGWGKEIVSWRREAEQQNWASSWLFTCWLSSTLTTCCTFSCWFQRESVTAETQANGGFLMSWSIFRQCHHKVSPFIVRALSQLLLFPSFLEGFLTWFISFGAKRGCSPLSGLVLRLSLWLLRPRFQDFPPQNGACTFRLDGFCVVSRMFIQKIPLSSGLGLMEMVKRVVFSGSGCPYQKGGRCLAPARGMKQAPFEGNQRAAFETRSSRAT